MLNLFRCSSAENVDSRLVPKSKDDSLHYFVTDYFDEIKVEKLKVEETSLRECMGIMQKANTKKEFHISDIVCIPKQNQKKIYGIRMRNTLY